MLFLNVDFKIAWNGGGGGGGEGGREPVDGD